MIICFKAQKTIHRMDSLYSQFLYSTAFFLKIFFKYSIITNNVVGIKGAMLKPKTIFRIIKEIFK